MVAKRVLVFGDVMLDCYIQGSVSRISQEAPVPVLQVISETSRIGGAGNVANNLTSLGVETAGMFLSGEGAEAATLKNMLLASGICCDWLIHAPGIKTIKKTRAICKNQQIVRLDYDDHYMLTDAIRIQIRDRLPYAIQWADVVVISDYGKGTCEPELCQEIIAQSKKWNKPVIVDPKGHDWDKYRGASVITPNMSEINNCRGIHVENEDRSIEANYRGLCNELGVDYVLLTRSEKGMSLIGLDRMIHVPAEKREVYDVSGAGDTVVAVLAMLLEKDLGNIEFAIRASNVAAGIVVGKPGTAVVTRAELDEAIGNQEEHQLTRIYRQNEHALLEKQVRQWRERGESIATTNGCFDILHAGHIKLFAEAKRYVDHLIVAINSDASVKRLKGESRPINSEEDRAYVVASIKNVDAVVLFDPQLEGKDVPPAEMQSLSKRLQAVAKEAPMGLLRLIRPDVHVKGGDYAQEDVPEAMYAGKFVAIPYVAGRSTTGIIQRAREDGRTV